MFLSALVAFLFLYGVFSELSDAGNRVRIPMSISVKADYAVTVSGNPDHIQPNYRQSISLYDFDKQLEARKVMQEGVCYIKKFTGTSAQIKGLVDAANLNVANSVLTARVLEEFNIPGAEIKSDDLEETLGARIPVFCSGYKVHWMRINRKIRKLQDDFSRAFVSLLCHARRKRSWDDNMNLGQPVVSYRDEDVSATVRAILGADRVPVGGSVTMGGHSGGSSVYAGAGYNPYSGYSVHGGAGHDFGGGTSVYGGGMLHQNGHFSLSAGFEIKF